MKTAAEIDAERDRVIDAATAMLSEHFDAVQVMATHLDADGSTNCKRRGSGNFYARMAMAREWINTCDVRNAIEESREQQERDETE